MSQDKPIINDWTKETLVIDLTNSLGEQYHFEIEPEADPSSIPSRPAGGPTDNVVLNMFMPLLGPVIYYPPHSPTDKKSKGKK